MKIVSVELSKPKLLGMLDGERSFFFGLGHIANEINAVTKVLYWAAGAPGRNDAETHGRLTFLLLSSNFSPASSTRHGSFSEPISSAPPSRRSTTRFFRVKLPRL